MYLFHVSESTRLSRWIMTLWDIYFFYDDCPGPAVFMGDFAAGFSTAMAGAAADQVIAERKAVIDAISKGKGRDTSPEAYNPLPTALLDEADSQTIIIDMVADPAPSMHLYNGSNMLLQRCEWHGASAIRRRLIHNGYKKERRGVLMNKIWEWIKAPSLEVLESSRDALILKLKVEDKEYLTTYYQPKESTFICAYTSKYLNLGCNSIQRNEKQYHVLGGGLSKNITL
jgi:hypothetical protein